MKTRAMHWLFVAVLLGAQLSRADTMEDARRIQRTVLGVDGHNDTVQDIAMFGADIGQRRSEGSVDLPRLREGGMHVPFFALYVPAYYPGADAVRRTLDLRDAMQSVFDRYPQQIELATSAADIERIVGHDKIAAVLSIEGGHQIDDDLAVLRMYRHLGILSMTLTHFRNNHWADSATAPAEHNGLTEFGRQVVREMNRIGMLIDLSHASDKTFYDTLAVSTRPVIVSHSSCRALVDMPRNMSDDMLVALGKNGGVVGVNFYAGYLNSADAESARKSIAASTGAEPTGTGVELDRYAARERETDGERHPPVGQATVADAVACIDHAVKVAGIDHVGIGADFDGVSAVPRGLEDVSKMPAVTAGLLERGYREADIRKIMGENFLRVIRSVVGH